MTPPVLALSIRQPHVHAILNLDKRFENRERSDGGIPTVCRHVGPLLLHASGGMTQKEFWHALGAWRDDGRITFDQHAELALMPKTLLRGGIVGYARAIGRIDPGGWFHPGTDLGDTWPAVARQQVRSQGCCQASFLRSQGYDLRWWARGHALVLADVHELPFVRCPGRLGLWKPPADVLRRLGPHLRKPRAP